MKKTVMRDTTLVDVLVVGRGLPQDEIDQIEALSGRFDLQDLAMTIMNATGPKWTCVVKETGEPIVVAGFIQVGVNIWRSYMLANERAWKEFGVEVTVHSRNAVKEMVRGQQHIRLETVCLASRKKAQEWYPKIGLTYESTLPGYGVKGETAVMYTKTQGAEEN